MELFPKDLEQDRMIDPIKTFGDVAFDEPRHGLPLAHSAESRVAAKGRSESMR